MYRHFGNGDCFDGADAVESGCVAMAAVRTGASNDRVTSLGAMLTTEIFSAPATDSYVATITTVWRETCPGWFLLGELDKYVALPSKRFELLGCSSPRVSVLVKGSKDENVTVSALRRVGGSVTDPRFVVVQNTVSVLSGGFVTLHIDSPPDL